jgi:urease subunit alpha
VTDRLTRPEYAAVYGPTVGDRIRLGDTGLVLEVPQDDNKAGEELLIGFGKTARDGIGMRAVSGAESMDLVVTNVVLVDPEIGVRKTSIGIRGGRVSAIGRAGNPDIADGITVPVGVGTAIVNGEGMIATPGGIDTHVHLLSPRVVEAELSSGMTTVIGQEYGPMWGVGVSDPYGVHRAIEAFDAWPINVGLLGRGSSSRRVPLEEALVRSGVCGFKVHEDTGANARALDMALTVAEDFDVQVAIHTDGLNESLAVADTLRVIEGRSVHAFHVEGCGGGHVPDVLTLAGVPNVIGSSTNPTLPFGRDATAEHLAMIVSVHALKPHLASDLQMAHDRIRGATMGAEGVLHDLGVIPITSSDAQGMGRAGETFSRTFALAGVMKAQRGPLPEDSDRHDNARILRYLAKLTINPARAHGLDGEVGSLAVGKLADLVLWEPHLFGAKPTVVLKGGMPAWGVTGDPNATIDTAAPLVYGPLFGGMGSAPSSVSVMFTNSGALAAGTEFPTARRLVATHGCRSAGLATMARHGRLGEVTVHPDSAEVRLDGDLVTSSPVAAAPLSRLYLV